jgi:hypothetical protein
MRLYSDDTIAIYSVNMGDNPKKFLVFRSLGQAEDIALLTRYQNVARSENNFPTNVKTDFFFSSDILV